MKTLFSFLFALSMLFSVTELEAQCGTPSNRTAVANSGTSITFSWNIVPGAGLYQLQYKKTTSLTWTTILVGGTTRTQNNLICGTNYMYRVRAICGTNYGAYTTTGYISTQACCTPPSGLQLTASIDPFTGFSGQYLLSWNASPNAVDYNVEYKLPSASAWTVIGSGWAGTAALLYLTGNTSYQFRVQSIFSGGVMGCYSNIYTTVSPCPFTPSGVSVSAINFNSAVISWNSASGACDNLKYRVAGGGWQTLGICGVGAGVSSPYTLSGLASNTTYEVQVVGVDFQGGGTCPSNIVTFTTWSGGSSCPAPTITHSNIGGSHFCGEITSSTISGANTYTLQKRETVGGVWGAWGTIATSSTAFSMYNVCTYPCEYAEYRVFVTCNGVNSAYSNTAGGTYNCRLAAPNSVTEKASIYPNPTMGILHVELNTEDDFGSEISLVDMTGRKVKVFQIEDKSDKAELDLSELDNGIYTLILNEGSIQKMERVVIAR